MNHRETIDIQCNPSDELYRRLLSFAAQFCPSALLVVRPSMPLDPSGEAFLAAAAPWLESVTEASEWPGTQLIDHTARVYRLRLEPGLLQMLEERASSLFDWVQPELPEDLCLLRADGEPWLVTISHERDAYLQITREELSLLVGAVPGISACLSISDA